MIVSILGTSEAFFNPVNCSPKRDEKGKVQYKE